MVPVDLKLAVAQSVAWKSTEPTMKTFGSIPRCSTPEPSSTMGLMRKFMTLLMVLAITLATSCSGQAPDDTGDPALDAMKRSPALPWLRSNGNASALATNRFGPTSAAIEFVEALLQAGATEVYVADPYGEPERIADEGGPYADTLIVELPTDPERRAGIFRILVAEAASEGFDPPVDNGQRLELLWWD